MEERDRDVETLGEEFAEGGFGDFDSVLQIRAVKVETEGDAEAYTDGEWSGRGEEERAASRSTPTERLALHEMSERPEGSKEGLGVDSEFSDNGLSSL